MATICEDLFRQLVYQDPQSSVNPLRSFRTLKKEPGKHECLRICEEVIAKNVPARSGTRTFSSGIAYIDKHEHKRQQALAHAGVSFTDRVQYASGEEKAAWTHTRGVTSVRGYQREQPVDTFG